MQVTATDEDDGLNGQVRYATVAHGGGDDDSPLTIDAATGELSLRRELDYERDDTHVALVAAHDAGPAATTAYARVVVHVTDVNDHAPDIRVHAAGNTGGDDDVVVDGESDECDAVVGEHRAAGASVAQVAVVDRDSGDNGRTECRLELASTSPAAAAAVNGTSSFALRRVHAAVFTVATAASLDRELVDLYRLSVACVDGGRLEARAPLTVCIGDSNDHAPAFDAPRYTAAVAEDAAVGTAVLRVTAADRDLRQNGDVHYHIRRSGDDDDDVAETLFAVDQRDGTITTTGALDRENHTRFDLVVVATDRGRPRLSSAVPVTLTVTDVNDEGPRFSEPAYEFETYENEPVGTAVGSLSVSDDDSSPYDRFRLYVLNDADAPETDDAFGVDSRTGRLVTLVPLDRERCAVHRLTVVARDDHPPHFTSTASVAVRVLDRNDNAPLVHAVAGVVSFSVSAARAFPGHLLGVVRAVDADSGVNARLHWSVADGDDRQLFVLDELTGQLSVSAHADLAVVDVDRFQLSVLVHDDGLPPRSTFVKVLRLNTFLHEHLFVASLLYNLMNIVLWVAR